MISKYEKDLMILASMCDHTGKLSITGCANLFMDIATEHAESIGIGLSYLSKENKFWLTVKSRIDFKRRPSITEKVKLATWPEGGTGVKCNRYYVLSKGDEILALGKTEWSIINLNTNRLEKLQTVFPSDFNFLTEKAIDEQFTRVTEEFNVEPFAKYSVKSIDIDLGNHMNNVAYIRAFESLFSTKEREELDIKSFEIQYKKSCFEGDTIEFRKVEKEDSTLVKASVNDDTNLLIVLR